MDNVFWKSLNICTKEHESLGQYHSCMSKGCTYSKVARKRIDVIIIYIPLMAQYGKNVTVLPFSKGC